MISTRLRHRLLDPRNGEDWDLPPSGQPRRIYVVASTPRTGSTLLCRSLWDTGLAGAPKEYLNPMQLRDWEVRMGTTPSRLRHQLLDGRRLALISSLGWNETRLDDHLKRVMALRTGPGGLFGMKLHAHHHRKWFAQNRLTERFGEVTWVRIIREDRLAQAISWERALQSGRWAAHQPVDERTTHYSRGAITRRLRAIERDEIWWRDRLAGERVLQFSYETLRVRRARCVREVLAYLGVEGAGAVGVHQAPLTVQADAVSEEWARRYRSGS